jgi:hypothetical protein
MVTPGSEEHANVSIKLSYEQAKSQQEIARLTADVQRATEKLNRTIMRATSASQSERYGPAQGVVSEVERIRQRIQRVLEASSRPYSRENVLQAAGLNPVQIRAASTELDRAGSSIAGMERALRRVNIPVEEARGIALALKEATYEAQAFQSRINQTFFRFRRIAEQGVRLAELGFTLGAGGAAILTPLTLAANQYTERYRALEETAARFTAVQYAQQQAISRLGREASTALVPILEEVTRLFQGLADLARDNPELLRGMVVGASGLVAVGALSVLIGKLESAYGRIGAFFFSQAPGSLNLRNLILGQRQEEGGPVVYAGGAAGRLIRAGVFVAGVAVVTSGLLALGNAIAEATGTTEEWQARLDINKDGLVDFNDVMTAVRVGIYKAIESVIDFMFRLATAIASVAEFIVSIPQRVSNLFQGYGFVTDREASQQRREEGPTRIQELMEDSSGLVGRLLRARRDAQSLADVLSQDIARQEQRLAELRSQEVSEDTQRQITEAEESINWLTERLNQAQRDIAAATEALETAQSGDEVPELLSERIERMRAAVIDALPRHLAEIIIPEVAQRRREAERAASEPEVAPELLDLFRNYLQGELRAEQQFNQQLAENKRQFRLQELEAERQHQRQLAQLAIQFKRSERDAAERFAFEQEQRAIQFARKEAEIERKRQEDRLRKLREHELRLTELAAARDVAGFIEARKRFELEMQEEERQAQIDKKERKRQFDEENADRLRQYEEQRRMAKRAYQEQIDDANRNYEEQRAARQRQFDEQLQQMRVEFQRQRDERFRDFAQQLDDLRVSQGQLSEERRAFNAQVLAGYQELMSAHTQLLSNALKQAYGLAPFANLNVPTITGQTTRTPPRAITIRSGAGGGGGLRMYQEGARLVPYTGLAMLHQGERVLTNAQNRAWGPMLDALENGAWPSGGHVTNIYVTGNAFGHVATQEDVRQLALAIVDGIRDSEGML